jgi:hypothetical protein
MADYIPRIILLDSETIVGTSFICGFVSLPEPDLNGINPGVFYPAAEDNLPYILYTEDKSIITDGGNHTLPPFRFSGKNAMPKEIDVVFQDISGKKKPKIKVTATMGHPDDDLPDMYQPRNFILCDFTEGLGGTANQAYGFLIDIFEGDQLVREIDAENWTVSVDTSQQISQKADTYIFIFPINQIIASYELNLTALDKGISTISTKGAPEYNTINQ